MAQALRFLHPIRVYASPFKFSFSAKFDRFYTLAKSLEASSDVRRISSSNWKSYVQRYVRKSSFSNSGREFSIARFCGMSIVVGSVGLWPRYASCSDVYDKYLDDHRMNTHRMNTEATDSEEYAPAFLTLVMKLLAPVFLLYIVWMDWGHPAIIGAKTILILLSTKPSRISVYVLIDKWQRQFKSQHPILHKLKVDLARRSLNNYASDTQYGGIRDFISTINNYIGELLYIYLVMQSLYAKKVEVEDYTFLWVATVELDDKTYTLIGILGGWWVLERTSLQGTFSSFKRRVTEILYTPVLL